jgi:hypothetical protein
VLNGKMYYLLVLRWKVSNGGQYFVASVTCVVY